MGKLDKPGYPLPDGELGEDELACTIVYYPDRPEYRQALVSSLFYLATWRAWERDTDKRGKDAAADWKLANDLTLECLYMSCFEELQANVAAILALLQLQDNCCDDNTTWGESDEFETDIVPDVGDSPDYYGETEVDDWDDWRGHVCFNAHAWVDELILQAGNIEAGLEFGGTTIALIAGAIVGISFFVVGGVVAMPFVYAAVAGIVGVIASTAFDDAADDLEAARDSIVCAFLQGTSVADAVENALGSGAVWDLFYSLLDYDSAVAIIYEGGDGDNYLDDETSDACLLCGEAAEYLMEYKWPDSDDWKGWNHNTGDSIASGNPDYAPEIRYNSPLGFIRLSTPSIAIRLGVSDEPDREYSIHKITFDYKMDEVHTEKLVFQSRTHSGLGWAYPVEFDNVKVWTTGQILWEPARLLQDGGGIQFLASGGPGGFAHIDNVRIFIDTEIV
jgi:hypothetical protein